MNEQIKKIVDIILKVPLEDVSNDKLLYDTISGYFDEKETRSFAFSLPSTLVLETKKKRLEIELEKELSAKLRKLIDKKEAFDSEMKKKEQLKQLNEFLSEIENV